MKRLIGLYLKVNPGRTETESSRIIILKQGEVYFVRIVFTLYYL